ncbi:CRISPR system precrRNA processing endoribonuclease RAMP protein Cas6 [bacterium]|nr:CRISPR system precrRNA processing endoribonuclease RAMP protein Cas6 [bacterium]
MTTQLLTLPEPEARLLPQIRAVRLVIRTRWRRPNLIPGPVVANVLRGALGITFRKLVCPEGWLDHACHPCPLYAECGYGQVFAPTPPDDATQLRLQQDLPRPFVIEPPGLHPDEPITDAGLTFRLMLFGTAIERLPYFISTLDRLGHDGLGRDRVPFRIEQIATCHPAGDEVLYTGDSTTVRLPQRTITTDDLLSSPIPTLEETGTPLCLRLDFLTPLLLKSGSGIDSHGRRIAATEIRERPPFGVIARRLRDRLSALCTFFGEPWRHPDFASLGTQADRVSLVDSHTVWLTRSRRSTRTGDAHEISGLVGHATYEFPDDATFAALSPLLKIGELLHVGKHAPWGNGAIKMTQLVETKS